MKYLGIITMTIIIFSLTGCATIVSKSTYPVNITSTPEKTNFTIINKKGKKMYSGVTPTIINLKAGGMYTTEKYTLLFEKFNYIPYETHLNGKFDEWYIGNIVFGGLLGILIVDPMTGAMFKLHDLHVDMNNFTTSIPNKKYKKYKKYKRSKYKNRR